MMTEIKDKIKIEFLEYLQKNIEKIDRDILFYGQHILPKKFNKISKFIIKTLNAINKEIK